MTKGTVWLVDDDRSIRWVLEKTLQAAQINCHSFADAYSVLEALKTDEPEVLISDIRMPGLDGLSLLKQLQQQCPQLPVIIMTAHSDLDAAVNAYQTGAFEYLTKPFDIDEAVTLVERAISYRNEQHHQQLEQNSNPVNAEILGEAPAMQEVFRAIGRL